MPCFYCGKRVSLVRQITDADFCCDEHRKRYQDLTRLALDRLMEAGEQKSAPRRKAEHRHAAEPETPAPPAFEPPTPPQAAFLAPPLPAQRDTAPAPPAGATPVTFEIAPLGVNACPAATAPELVPKATGFLRTWAPATPACAGKPAAGSIAPPGLPRIQVPRPAATLPPAALAYARGSAMTAEPRPPGSGDADSCKFAVAAAPSPVALPPFRPAPSAAAIPPPTGAARYTQSPAPAGLPLPSAAALPAIPALSPALVLPPYRSAIVPDTAPAANTVSESVALEAGGTAVTTVPELASFAAPPAAQTLPGACPVQIFAPRQLIAGGPPSLPARLTTELPPVIGLSFQFAATPGALLPATRNAAPAIAAIELALAASPIPPAHRAAACCTKQDLAAAEALPVRMAAAAMHSAPAPCAASLAAGIVMASERAQPAVPTGPRYSLAQADLAAAPAPGPARRDARTSAAGPVQPAASTPRVAAVAAPSAALNLPASALRALTAAARQGYRQCVAARSPSVMPAPPQRPAALSVGARAVLDTAPLEALAACAAARPAAPAASGWRVLSHDAASPHLQAAGPGLGPVYWPGPDSQPPQPEPQPDARPSPESSYLPAAPATFEVALRWLAWSQVGECLLAVAETPTAPPQARQDDRAAVGTAGRAPLLGRGVRAAAPVLAAAPGDAAMRRSAFFSIEVPDTDDEGTSGRGRSSASRDGGGWHAQACIAALSQPSPEPFDFAPYRLSTIAFEGLRRSAAPLLKTVTLTLPMLLASMLVWGAGGDSFRSTMQARAAVRLGTDFHQGLDGWFGGRDWARHWKRDPAGFVRVGQLGLYRPSMAMKSYRLEFFGEIEQRQIGWVYRAADLRNYYAMKLEVVKPGPLPGLVLVRYAVIAGQESQRVQVPIRIVLRNGRAYHFQVNIYGNDFTTLIDKQVVDYWSDDRLKAGGVGFFTDSKDDRPHIYWLKVSYQDDFWGKVCALIAPAN